MKNMNRYNTNTNLIKDAIHWPLTNRDSEYAKLRKQKKRIIKPTVKNPTIQWSDNYVCEYVCA